MSITKLLNIKYPIFQGAMSELATVECPTRRNSLKLIESDIEKFINIV